MGNKEKIKELKKLKRDYSTYYALKYALLGWVFNLTLFASKGVMDITGLDPFTNIATKNSYVVEQFSNTGEDGSYSTVSEEFASALDEILVRIQYNTYEDGVNCLNVAEYTIEKDENLLELLKKDIYEITEEDILKLNFKLKRPVQKGYYVNTRVSDYSQKIYVYTTYLGEKVEYIQSFEDNLMDVGFAVILMPAIFMLLKSILYNESVREHFIEVSEARDYLKKEIIKIKEKK